MWHERLTCPWPRSRTFSEPEVKLTEPHFPCSALHAALTAAPQQGFISSVKSSGGQILKSAYYFCGRPACLLQV